jgi:hypothetical protein
MCNAPPRDLVLSMPDRCLSAEGRSAHTDMRFSTQGFPRCKSLLLSYGFAVLALSAAHVAVEMDIELKGDWRWKLE